MSVASVVVGAEAEVGGGGPPDNLGIWLSKVHSVCMRTLRRTIELGFFIGVPAYFRLLFRTLGLEEVDLVDLPMAQLAKTLEQGYDEAEAEGSLVKFTNAFNACKT